MYCKSFTIMLNIFLHSPTNILINIYKDFIHSTFAQSPIKPTLGTDYAIVSQLLASCSPML